MLLKDVVGIAIEAAFSAPEFAAFVKLADLYEDAKLRGDWGLRPEDLQPEDVEFLIELFDYSAATGCYVSCDLDQLIKLPTKPATEAHFEQFWSLYPRKVAKANARKVWLRLVKTPRLADQVIRALRNHVQANEWLIKEQQFIPHAATWLGQQRWEDELQAPQQASGFVGVV